ncbi:S46 family peptidase [uncultured Alloprevotella sp.]|uniref:S46 family peptidase n=1 Tax=uncultured Alloprevotella sp. TaxID=1283315 RepID=UPI00325FC0B3
MKKILLFAMAVLCSLVARADEGMWLLKLMEQQHLADSLRKAGLQLPPSQLYSETGPSLKDVVGIFGNGCTGEVVSPDGLIFTNNHCGFSYIHAMSSVEKNYLKDGFFAKSRAEELPTPNLTFTFVLAIEDVTVQVEAEARRLGIDKYTRQSYSFTSKMNSELRKKSKYAKLKGIESTLLPFFGGNQFYIIYMQEYTDVRLVADPPLNVAQFGGNSDNWVWPRQNVDWCAFRIYADKSGQPAPYSPQNVPLKRKNYLRISSKGIQEGDYTMVMGFPGSTSRFLTSEQVALRVNSINQPIVAAGWPVLDLYKKYMEKNDSIRLVLESTNMRLGNMVKNYDGMIKAVRNLKLIDEKRREEKRFQDFAHQSGKPEYQTVVADINKLCKTYQDSIFDDNLLYATLGNIKYPASYRIMQQLLAALKANNRQDIQNSSKDLLESYDKKLEDFTKDYVIERTRLLLPIWEKNCRLPISRSLQVGNPYELISQSIFASRKKLETFLANPSAETLTADPIYKMIKDIDELSEKLEGTKHFKMAVQPLEKTYVRGLEEMYNNSKAPDANFTLRMTYGHVKAMKPRDGVLYDWRTTLKGMFEKEDSTNIDYIVHPRMRQLYEARDFGRYAREDGQLPTCFISNNDITGGNSGSPVMNAKGELIGLAFDGNIEALSSDLKFDPELQRCINVDIRYVLWILDKFGESKYLFNEMEIH